jgi:hypothetical protein
MNALDIFVVGFVLIALPSIITVWGYRIAKRLYERRNRPQPQATPTAEANHAALCTTAHDLGIRFPSSQSYDNYDAPAFTRVAV